MGERRAQQVNYFEGNLTSNGGPILAGNIFHGNVNIGKDLDARKPSLILP
jgi:hypothetical protein